MRQGQGQGRGAERGHLHAGLGCGATWGRLPSLGAWQRAALAAYRDGRGCLCRAERPVQSILFPVCCTEGVRPENCPCGLEWGGRTPSILDSTLNSASSKEHPPAHPGAILAWSRAAGDRSLSRGSQEG